MKESAVHIYLKNPQGEPKNIGIFYFSDSELERLAADWEEYLAGNKKGACTHVRKSRPLPTTTRPNA